MPVLKDRNDEKPRNLNVIGKQMTGVLFSSTKIDLADLISLESWIWSEILPEENNKSYVAY